MSQLRYICFLLFMMAAFFLLPECKGQLNAANTEEFDHWDNGSVKECRKYDSEHNLIEKDFHRQNGTLEQVQKFDDDGNKIEESYFDQEERLCRNPIDQYASKRCKYIDGQLIKESWYDELGRLMERKIYDEHGNLLERQFIGDPRIDKADEYVPQVPVMTEQKNEYFNSDGKLLCETEGIRY